MSSARMRQQRRKGNTPRAPGVLRQDRQAAGQGLERLEHSVRNELTVSWRLFSGGIVACLVVVLLVFFATDLFYVRGITVEGAQYLDESEVFRYADIAEMHAFWVDPARVRQNILESTSLIADVEVSIGWPPDIVTIVVEEREPVLLWLQGGVRVLVDLQGNVLRSPRDDEQFPGLPLVIADSSFDGPRLPGDPVPVDAVNGVLQLSRLIAGLPTLQYNATKGLGFREVNRSWDVWLGVGTDMQNKLRVYETLRDNLIARGITPVEINVADLNAVYYSCGSIELCYE
ncbi:MAG: cell division protein FtsQ/DivIB [Chloroflexota bacterium]